MCARNFTIRKRLPDFPLETRFTACWQLDSITDLKAESSYYCSKTVAMKTTVAILDGTILTTVLLI